ncbi:hypothetical protein E4U50_006698 [Claviceps purpurea]|nr:hypothetical protein E4U50_006698 [Claviceps purpurea]KAG6222468.1 hypothetical protein E4U26_005251 [Claviceps purpurea]
MKFSTILGTFALSSLEAYRAYASPLDSSPAVLSLEERGQTEYCCMQVDSVKGVVQKFVPYSGGSFEIARYGRCTITVVEEGLPSQGLCPVWWLKLDQCDNLNVRGSSRPAWVCQK